MSDVKSLDDEGLERLQNYIEEYASESPQNRVKDLARKFGIRGYEGYNTLEAFAYDLAHEADGSGKVEEVIDYLAGKNPSSRLRYYNFLSKYRENNDVTEEDEKIKSEHQTPPRPIVKETEVKEKQYEPDPTKNAKYFEILQIIQQAGRNMERSSDDDEERLRNELLNVLKNKLTDKAVTAEEFNRKGHTDIKISHNNETLFIAECKIWKGLIAYKKAISQLMDCYLTWRNRHAAVILFVKQKNIQNVLQKIYEETNTHSNFDKPDDIREESWFNFTFHISHNKKIKVKLAVLVFHVY